MDHEKILDLVKQYGDNKEFITNEETAKMALVVPFVRSLGYDPNSPREVRMEYCASFVQGDGKRLPDRMDFAIFDSSGLKPLMVIETKPLGTDLRAKAQQLARYLAQMPDLHFGIITDGCHYHFFGDLDRPNMMDAEPFFSFSLDDMDTDWLKVAKFLKKFSREVFNSETLVTDAENSRYREAMVKKLANALRKPAEDETFMRWLTDDLYKGKRTSSVMERLGSVAKESIEPALLRVMSDDFLAKLRDRMQQFVQDDKVSAGDLASDVDEKLSDQASDSVGKVESLRSDGIVTTEDELLFYKTICDICAHAGASADEILYRDTVNYFNVSYRRPTKWFVRYFSGSKRKALCTHLSVDEARSLAPSFDVEEAPAVFGKSRIYIQDVAQLWAVKAVILRSLEVLQSGGANTDESTEAN